MIFGIFVVGCVLSVATSLPYHEDHSDNVDAGFIGKGTKELATSLLQGDVQKEEDMVYSPFGYSAVLAIFSEGARGSSREEIADSLHYPKDVNNVRLAYKSVLERFVGKKFSNSPEFKNWFYIYKNYTVNKELENVLRKYYLTEVKCVSRPEEYIKETTKGNAGEKTEVKTTEVPPEQPEQHGEKTGVRTTQVPAEETEQPSKNAKQQTSSMVEESLTVEEMKPEVVEENVRKEEVVKAKNLDSVKGNMEKREEDMATDVKMEEKDVEMDHFSGMTNSSLKIKDRESQTQMVIFNGLYYKGEWETSFDKKPADDSRPFYKSDKEKVYVSTIHSQGVFNYGAISGLDCRAIELPYKGGRYSLLVLVPNERTGLSKLISDLSGYSFGGIYDQLSEKLVDVCMPTFEINTISKPISSFSKLGLNKVTSIFNPDTADLTGISTNDSGLYVQELVQMVTFKVDAEYSKANFLTASIASSRSNVQVFQINQPFLFYLRDNIDDIIIVNGKVIDPTPKPSFYFS